MTQFNDKSANSSDLVPLVVAAKELGLRYGATMDLVLTGRLEGVQIGRSWFVDRLALAQVAKAARQGDRP